MINYTPMNKIPVSSINVKEGDKVRIKYNYNGLPIDEVVWVTYVKDGVMYFDGVFKSVDDTAQ